MKPVPEKGRSFLCALLIAAACLQSGCQAPRIEDTPLAQSAIGNPERRSLDLSDPDRPLIIMTFSGGGTRAAVLAAAVVQELGRHTYQTGTGTHRLSEDIQIISSVSGGSVAAGWIGLHGTSDFAQLDEAFLSRDEMGPLIDAALDPVTWSRLALTDFTRIDALEDLLDRQLFHGARMAALNQP